MSSNSNSNSYSHIAQFIKLFETLTFFPQQEICKQLDESSLLLVSLLSEKWEQIVRNYYGKKEEFVWEITLSKNILMIYVIYKDERKKKKNFQIGFKEDPNSSEDFYFEHDTRWNSTTFYFKTAHKLEKFSFKALDLISYVFSPTTYHSYHRITVPLGPRCPDFPFRFLAKLPFGTATYADLQADQEVECANLVQFLRNVNLRCQRLSVNLRLKNVVPCDEVFIHGRNLTIADARFLTRESLRIFDWESAEIGENNFTSQDFNEFFQTWTRGSKQNSLEKISFAIRKDQKINVEEVLKGLRVHDGEPRVRDRWYMDQRDEDLYPKAIDCGQAHTILRGNGYPAAILFEPNRLSFFNFARLNNWSYYDSLIDSIIQYYTGTLQYSRTDQKQLEMKIAAQGVKAEAKDLEELIRGSDKIEMKQKDFEEALELKEKLNTVWKNDGVVNYAFRLFR